uniref:Uncharacterized protein n=1 Tax=Acrobeloides nanus TaxID=290746 RepID=A0A914BZQ7_9BILA
MNMKAKKTAVTLRDIVNYICQRDPNNSICTSYRAAFNNSTKDVIGLNVILANKTDNNKDLEVKQVVLDEVNSTVETLVENNETPKERDLPIDDLDKTNSQDPQVLVFKKNSSNFESARKEYCSSFKSNYTKLCLSDLTPFSMPEEMRKVKLFCGSYRINCQPHYGIDCTPECDEKFHPHCTVECKCDYLYPLIVKFCRPLHVPSMEETCNSWFGLCSRRYVFEGHS